MNGFKLSKKKQFIVEVTWVNIKKIEKDTDVDWM